MQNDGHQNYKKIQCWIPNETWGKIEELGYSTTTAAVTEAFKKLLENPGNNPIESQEIPTLRARLEELEKHNDTLKAKCEDIKSIHNNYMLQMQTLINQKAIEAPGAKKPWWRFW